MKFRLDPHRCPVISPAAGRCLRRRCPGERERPRVVSDAETERARGRLIATTSAEAALRNTEVTLICVGTPSNGNGSVKLEYLENVCAEVGTILKTLGRDHTVVIRSTVMPNTG